MNFSNEKGAVLPKFLRKFLKNCVLVSKIDFVRNILWSCSKRVPFLDEQTVEFIHLFHITSFVIIASMVNWEF